MSKEKNVYLELEGSTGRMYEYSKEEKDGFIKHTAENPKTKKTSISYRRYFEEGVYGNLKGLSIRETDFGQKLSVFLDNPVDDKRYFLSFPIFDPKNDIATYATSIIAYLPNLIEGKPYRFFPYAIEEEANGKTRKKYGVSIKIARLSDGAVDDVNAIPRLSFEYVKKNPTGDDEIVAGDVPKTEWEEDFAGKMQPNNKNRNKFLWNTLKEHLIISEDGGSTKKTFNSMEENEDDPNLNPKQEEKAVSPNKSFDSEVEKKAEPKKEATKKAAVVEESDDDDDDSKLPF